MSIWYNNISDYAPYLSDTKLKSPSTNMVCFASIDDNINTSRNIITKQPINIFVNAPSAPVNAPSAPVNAPSAHVPAPIPPVSAPAPWIAPPSTNLVTNPVSIHTSQLAQSQIRQVSSLRSAPMPNSEKYSTKMSNIVFPKEVIGMVSASNINNCRDLCMADEDCDKWSYLPDISGNNCELKYNQNNKIIIVPKAASGQIYHLK